MVTVRFIKIHENAVLPSYATEGSSGMDLVSVDQVRIEPGKHGVVSTGLKIALPRGYEGQVRSRSGLAAKHAIFVLNSPGTIDADYRGELKVILANHNSWPYTVNQGDRVAQLVVAPVQMAEVQLTTEFDSTNRGEGGFGSTGR